VNSQVRIPIGQFFSGSLRQSPACAAIAAGVLAVASEQSAKPEIFRRVTGVRGYRLVSVDLCRVQVLISRWSDQVL